MNTYNLLDEKWIPVLFNNGTNSHVGIIEAFTRAQEIREIAASNPMDRVAILRFLLALLYWCKDGPSDQIPEAFPSDWFKKLGENKNCFNLFGEEERFYQDKNAKRRKAATHLIQELPSGNNFWHFRHSTDMNDGLCPACCALGLLRLPLFSVGGVDGRGNPNFWTGINGVPPIYVVPSGISLRDTLLANWSFHKNLGEPSWSTATKPINANESVPLLNGLTLLSRKVLLIKEEGQVGVCINCGLRKELIREIEFQSAGKQENEKWTDPHVVYLSGTEQEALRAQNLMETGKFRVDRLEFGQLAQIVATRKPVDLLIVGFVTKQAKNIDVWECVLTAPKHQGVPTFTTRWKDEGGALDGRLRSIVRGEKKQREGDVLVATAAIDSIRPHVEAKVLARASALIEGSEDAWEQAANEYRPMMAAVAQSLSPGFTTVALQRRKQFAKITPDMSGKKFSKSESEGK